MDQMVVGGLTINLERKRIKNLRLGVYPPDGRVRVAAPLQVNDDAVRLFVLSKLAWIMRHKARFTGLVQPSARQYVSGEGHYFQGRRYRLNVIQHQGHPRVTIRDSSIIDMFVKSTADTGYRKRVLTEWHRRHLKEQIPPLIEKWQPIMGVSVAEWGVRQMKTKWGTCSIKARRIWLNLELARKPAHSLEYIVVHEMAHLLERGHGDRFKGLMDQFMPHWRQYRLELNRAPLGWEEREEEGE